MTTLDGKQLESQTFPMPDEWRRQADARRRRRRASQRCRRAGDARGAAAPSAPAAPGTVVLGGQSRFVVEVTDDGMDVYDLLDIVNGGERPRHDRAAGLPGARRRAAVDGARGLVAPGEGRRSALRRHRALRAGRHDRPDGVPHRRTRTGSLDFEQVRARRALDDPVDRPQGRRHAVLVAPGGLRPRHHEPGQRRTSWPRARDCRRADASASSSTTCHTTRASLGSSRWGSRSSSSAWACGSRRTGRILGWRNSGRSSNRSARPCLDDLVALERQHAARAIDARSSSPGARPSSRNWNGCTPSWTSSRPGGARLRDCALEHRHRQPRTTERISGSARASGCAPVESQRRSLKAAPYGAGTSSPVVPPSAPSPAFDFDRLSVEDVSRHFGRRRALAKVRFACEAGHHHRAARAERGGQVDAAVDPRHAGRADVRRRPVR